jgi:hypothetical protein
VTYTADDVNGFNAVVERSAPGVQKVAVAARGPVYSAGPVGVAKVGVAPAYAGYAGYAAPAKLHSAAPLGYTHGAVRAF